MATFADVLDSALAADAAGAWVSRLGDPAPTRFAFATTVNGRFTAPRQTVAAPSPAFGTTRPASVAASIAETDASAPPRATQAPPKPAAPWSPTARSSSRRLSPRQQIALATLSSLGAPLDADFTGRELRSAFRRLAHRYHPDRHHHAGADEHARLARLFAAMHEHYRCLLAVADAR